jgi:type VI secretion system protein ImpJ
MTARAVHWHEGMFLRPHHFQTAQRHWFHWAHLSEKWDVHYDWGLRSVELDHDALANYRFVVRALRARLRDGTLVAIPEDGSLPALDLKGAFDRDNGVTVFLAVPVVNLGRANVSANGPGEAGRYLLDTQELEDENIGINPQPVQVRLLNLKLLLSTQDHAGYEVLPVARVEKSSRAEATPQLDLAYIPPVLACDGWPPLGAGIVQTIYDRIGKKLELLAGQVKQRGIGMESQAPGDRLIFEQLRTLNEGYGLLGILAFAQGVHPLTAYLELARLLGQLAIFDKKIDHRVPDLPKYDHDDLGPCFYRLKQYLDATLDAIVEPDYKERPFIGAGLRMQVTLEPAWLESAWQMFVGVQSPLSTQDCINLLTGKTKNSLDMKIGSSERVDDIFRLGQRGLKFTHSPLPPRALPSLQGLIYFQVDRESEQEEWQNVQKSLTLAIRLNERRIEGNIQGQRVLKINTGTAQTVPLQFTLYVVARGK